eukprot:CAMPEP_0173394106 /NCGR_PEP_ID=MMETSP1356-20130122/25022_1 /TAXON_ID=77927 ORGANISM="Hemiselmis virescens, Strain PCC157" /NCGR_SAMPLE_ID=MMETSP1356 /ASSEMBLY_ACC=CAM_ASM_000847 /LENGTH=281 /DNA_ID=CAMNT_0014352309 /DNA_START=79 /DNA_END=925 /DNA_ORIENTATION=+
MSETWVLTERQKQQKEENRRSARKRKGGKEETKEELHAALNEHVVFDRANGLVLFSKIGSSKRGGWPSQWQPSPFVDAEGRKFTCAEQYMMYNKAKTFGEHDLAEQIMNTRYPSEQKRLGRLVQAKHGEAFWPKWDAVCDKIVEEGNMLKFSQNEALEEELFATTGLTLVEASSWDQIWGIGLSASDKRSRNPTKWKGTNRLGNALMKAREGCFAQLERAAAAAAAAVAMVLGLVLGLVLELALMAVVEKAQQARWVEVKLRRSYFDRQRSSCSARTKWNQ